MGPTVYIKESLSNTRARGVWGKWNLKEYSIYSQYLLPRSIDLIECTSSTYDLENGNLCFIQQYHFIF